MMFLFYIFQMAKSLLGAASAVLSERCLHTHVLIHVITKLDSWAVWVLMFYPQLLCTIYTSIWSINYYLPTMSNPIFGWSCHSRLDNATGTGSNPVVAFQFSAVVSTIFVAQISFGHGWNSTSWILDKCGWFVLVL